MSSTPSDFRPAYNLLRLPDIAAGLGGKVQNLDSGLDSGLDTGLNNRVDICTRFRLPGGRSHHITQQHSFDVTWCHELIICTLQKRLVPIYYFWSNNLAQSTCFLKSWWCLWINVNHSLLISRQWKYVDIECDNTECCWTLVWHAGCTYCKYVIDTCIMALALTYPDCCPTSCWTNNEFMSCTMYCSCRLFLHVRKPYNVYDNTEDQLLRP